MSLTHELEHVLQLKAEEIARLRVEVARLRDKVRLQPVPDVPVPTDTLAKVTWFEALQGMAEARGFNDVFKLVEDWDAMRVDIMGGFPSVH